MNFVERVFLWLLKLIGKPESNLLFTIVGLIIQIVIELEFNVIIFLLLFTIVGLIIQIVIELEFNVIIFLLNHHDNVFIVFFYQL